MSSWASEYLSALTARDSIEQQNKQLYTAYTNLAARKSHSLTAQDNTSNQTKAHSPPPSTTPVLSPVPAPASPRVLAWPRSVSTTAIPASSSTNPTGTGPGAGSPRWQDDLAAAQRRRAELEGELRTAQVEIERVRAQLTIAERRSVELTSENGVLSVKLRDRIDELRAKAKLVQDVHDESVALNLQLNVSEERNAALKLENEQLIQRWMTRMGREADALNEASRF